MRCVAFSLSINLIAIFLSVTCLINSITAAEQAPDLEIAGMPSWTADGQRMGKHAIGGLKTIFKQIAKTLIGDAFCV